MGSHPMDTEHLGDEPSGGVPSGDEPSGGVPSGDEPLSDDELAEMALAALPDQPLDADAVPLPGAWGQEGELPLWYMPAPAGGARGRTSATVAAVIIIALVAIVASGLCVTYGVIVIA